MCAMTTSTSNLLLSVLIGVATVACGGNVVEGTSAASSDTSGSSPTTTSASTDTTTHGPMPGSSSSTSTSTTATSESTTGEQSGSSEPATSTISADMPSTPTVEACMITQMCGGESDCLPTQDCNIWLGWCMDPCVRGECERPCVNAMDNVLGDDLCPHCDLTKVLEP